MVKVEGTLTDGLHSGIFAVILNDGLMNQMRCAISYCNLYLAL
jgi:hypothetical protein